MKQFKAVLSKEEFNDLVNLFQEAIKIHGMNNDCDLKARNIINKITEVKEVEPDQKQ